MFKNSALQVVVHEPDLAQVWYSDGLKGHDYDHVEKVSRAEEVPIEPPLMYFLTHQIYAQG